MAVTENNYTGDNSTVLFSFTFPYLETTDIKVSLDGVITTAYTLANATTVQFNTAPANDVAIRIYRETDDANLVAQFYPGSAIRSQDLNDNFTQSLYVAQETKTFAENTEANVSQGVADAALALTNSQTAITTANAASATATTADTNASAAVATANTASTNATTALNTANTADTNASAAVSTANTASTNASNAVTTANTADANATQALSLVSAVVDYPIIANVAAIPGSPANGDGVELLDSTGIQSFTPLTGVPAGFTGSSALRVKIKYTTTGNTWQWISYTAADSDARYVIQGKLGSQTSPSFYFDPNTGIYSPGADQVAISTGGTGRLFVKETGNVGLGTSTPAARLSIGGTASPGVPAIDLLPYNADANTTSDIVLSNNGVIRAAASIRNVVNASGFHAWSIGGSDVNGGVSGASEVMRITQTGNVGIGTINPAATLHVAGTPSQFQNNIFLGASTHATSRRAAISFNNDWIVGQDTAGNGTKDFGIYSAALGAAPFAIDTSGNVGIGTTAPGQKLDVAGNAKIGTPTGSAFVEIGAGATENRTTLIDFIGDTTYTDYGLRIIRAGTGANAASTIFHRGTGTFTLWTQDAAPIVFRTEGAERMRIAADGQVTVGGVPVLPTTTVTSTSKTLVNRERCTVTASGLTITLPTPTVGAEVTIITAGTFTDTIVDPGASYNIMGQTAGETMTIDKANTAVTLLYVDATRGWRII